jgi:hypothetical protein
VKRGVNIFCLSFFPVFFTFCFMAHTGSTDFDWFYYYQGETSFWKEWSNLLIYNCHVDIALVLDILSLPIVIMFTKYHKTYDKHRVSILYSRFGTVINVSFVPMAVFYLMIFKMNILDDILWLAGKFTFFVIVHWLIVLFVNIMYIIYYRRKRLLI